jgi:hypothetical protein
MQSLQFWAENRAHKMMPSTATRDGSCIVGTKKKKRKGKSFDPSAATAPAEVEASLAEEPIGGVASS